MTDELSYKEEAELYRDTLENGIRAICDAMGVSTERYDTDQADFACYMDCFKDAAELIKRAGYKFDEDNAEFISTHIPISKAVEVVKDHFNGLTSMHVNLDELIKALEGLGNE